MYICTWKDSYHSNLTTDLVLKGIAKNTEKGCSDAPLFPYLKLNPLRLQILEELPGSRESHNTQDNHGGGNNPRTRRDAITQAAQHAQHIGAKAEERENLFCHRYSV